MSSPKSSNSRGLIRAMLVIGSAQVVNIGLSILRMKVLAVLLGPSGVGLLSIYNNLQVMVSNAAGLGMKSSGVRQLAIAKGEEQALSRVRRVLLAAHLVQGVLAMLGVWLLQEQISVWLLGNTTYALEIALLGIAILLTLLMSAQTALLQGLRRIGDLGRVTVLGALGGTVVGLAAVWGYGQVGLIWFVLAQPLMGLAAALYFTRRLPNPTSPRLSAVETWEIWKPIYAGWSRDDRNTAACAWAYHSGSWLGCGGSVRSLVGYHYDLCGFSAGGHGCRLFPASHGSD
jgi:PST family polysaccharide transporter